MDSRITSKGERVCMGQVKQGEQVLYYKPHRKRINFYGIFLIHQYISCLTCVTKNATICVTRNVMERNSDKRYIYKALAVD